MTINNRNRLILLGLIIGLIVVAGIIFLLVFFSLNPQIVSTYQGRDLQVFSTDTAQTKTQSSTETGFFSLLLKPSSWTTVISIAFMCIFGTLSIFLVLTFFEKTQTYEISCFTFFAFSLLVESLRLIFPIANFYLLSDEFLRFATRFVLFSRIFGALSLLGAGLFSSKSMSQQLSRYTSIITIIAFFFATTTPLNALDKLQVMLISPGYKQIILIIIIFAELLSPISFFISGCLQGVSDLKKTGIGVLLLILGINTLLYTCMWIPLIIGITASILGTILFLKSIHKYYLWN